MCDVTALCHFSRWLLHFSESSIALPVIRCIQLSVLRCLTQVLSDSNLVSSRIVWLKPVCRCVFTAVWPSAAEVCMTLLSHLKLHSINHEQFKSALVLDILCKFTHGRHYTNVRFDGFHWLIDWLIDCLIDWLLLILLTVSVWVCVGRTDGSVTVWQCHFVTMWLWQCHCVTVRVWLCDCVCRQDRRQCHLCDSVTLWVWLCHCVTVSLCV